MEKISNMLNANHGDLTIIIIIGIANKVCEKLLTMKPRFKLIKINFLRMSKSAPNSQTETQTSWETKTSLSKVCLKVQYFINQTQMYLKMKKIVASHRGHWCFFPLLVQKRFLEDSSITIFGLYWRTTMKYAGGANCAKNEAALLCAVRYANMEHSCLVNSRAWRTSISLVPALAAANVRVF